MAERSVLAASSKARISSCWVSFSRWVSPITPPLEGRLAGMIDQDARIGQTFHADRSTHARVIGERQWLVALQGARPLIGRCAVRSPVRLAARSTWEAAVAFRAGAPAALISPACASAWSSRRAGATPAIAKKRGGEQVTLFVLRLRRRTVR